MFQRIVDALAFGDVEKAVHRADQFTLGIAQRIDIDRQKHLPAVGTLDQALGVAHRYAGGQHLGEKRPRHRRAVGFVEPRALAELVVGLTGGGTSAPDLHRAPIVLEDGAARVANDGGDRQQIENAVRRPQHRAQQRRNRLGCAPVVVGIKHPHASARGCRIPSAPGTTMRADGYLSMVQAAGLRKRR